MAVDTPTQVGPAVIDLVRETIGQVVAEHCPGRAGITRRDETGLTRIDVTPHRPDAAPLGVHMDHGELWIDMWFGDVSVELFLRRGRREPTLAEEIARITRAVVLGRYRERTWRLGEQVKEIEGVIDDEAGEAIHGRFGPLFFLYRLLVQPEARVYAPY